MRELITLSFGNYSNYVNTHFWNINEQFLKNDNENNDNYDNNNNNNENDNNKNNTINNSNVKLNQSVLYNHKGIPRSMIFDTQENIKPYFTTNEFEEKKEQDIQDSIDILNQDTTNFNLKKINQPTHQSNNFLKVMNNDKTLNKEVWQYNDEEFYNFFDFKNIDTIVNWNDFLQPRFNSYSLNEIKTIDLPVNDFGNYFKGFDFFSENKGYKSFYFEQYEDNFRKHIEDCDLVDKLLITCDQNSFWGGLCNTFVLDSINLDLPKVQKHYNTIYYNNTFFNEYNECDYQKLINYIFFYGDLLEQQSTITVNPIRVGEDNEYFCDLFDIKKEHINTRLFDFYTSSLCGLDLANLYIPYREMNFNKNNLNKNFSRNYLGSLISNNNVNFILTIIIYISITLFIFSF